MHQENMSSPLVNSTIGMSGQALIGGTHGYPSLASQLNYINSAKNSGSQIHNLMGSGGDGGSQTVYSTQYQAYLTSIQNKNSKLSDGLQMQSQQAGLLKNHMLSNSFMQNTTGIAPIGRGPLGHH